MILVLMETFVADEQNNSHISNYSIHFIRKDRLRKTVALVKSKLGSCELDMLRWIRVPVNMADA